MSEVCEMEEAKGGRVKEYFDSKVHPILRQSLEVLPLVPPLIHNLYHFLLYPIKLPVTKFGSFEIADMESNYA